MNHCSGNRPAQLASKYTIAEIQMTSLMLKMLPIAYKSGLGCGCVCVCAEEERDMRLEMQSKVELGAPHNWCIPSGEAL